MMHALIWDGRHLDAVDDLEVREPGAGEITVEIEAAGLCHSDLKPIDGDVPQQLPVVLGHEAAGRVVATGPGTTIAVGRRVVLSVLRACGTCEACTAGKTTMCRTPVPDSATPFSRHGAPRRAVRASRGVRPTDGDRREPGDHGGRRHLRRMRGPARVRSDHGIRSSP